MTRQPPRPRRDGDGEHDTRRERKERTRRALLDGALTLLSEHSFDSISLREVTREAGVTPTAFYRHFDDMDELGLALVEEAFGTLHDMVRAVRADTSFWTDVVHRSVQVVAEHARANREYMRFLSRERYGGVRRLRRAIRVELDLFANELAVDVARFSEFDDWSREDRQMFADLLVDTVVSTVSALVEARPEDEARIARRSEHQLRLVIIGVPNWRSTRSAERRGRDDPPGEGHARPA